MHGENAAAYADARGLIGSGAKRGWRVSIVAALCRLQRYSTQEDTWTTSVAIPTGRHSFSSAVVGGFVYHFGGDVLTNPSSAESPSVASNVRTPSPRRSAQRGVAVRIGAGRPALGHGVRFHAYVSDGALVCRSWRFSFQRAISRNLSRTERLRRAPLPSRSGARANQPAMMDIR